MLSCIHWVCFLRFGAVLDKDLVAVGFVAVGLRVRGCVGFRV